MSSIISSRSNPAIKQIRALRSRKERQQTGLFFVEGVRLVGEAVQLQAEIEALVVAPELLTSPFGRDLAEQRPVGAARLEVSADVFRSISSKENPQGLGALVRQRWESLEAARPVEGLCWVALNGVGDPGNLGTILRTCDAVGAAGVILLGDTTDPYDPAAVRGSMGAVFSQHLVRASFPDLLAWKARHGCHLVGTSDAASTDYQSVRYQRPLVLMMGSEAQGLSQEQQEACDTVVAIPMAGRSDSLNLAVATGVLLYEVFNQRRARGESA